LDSNESALRDAFLAAVKECRKIGYNPTRFVQMITERGAINTARSLLNATKTSDGFTELYMRGNRLDLSVEAIVLRPEYRICFTAAELTIARQRLRDVGYAENMDTSETVPDIVSPDTTLTTKGQAVVEAQSGILPPIGNAADLITRIKSVLGQPERNIEDVVKDLLLRLGHTSNLIVFQKGRIDLILQDSNGRVVAVFEVKRSIASSSEKAAARRQAMDYAAQTGAPILVITDADRYEIYDRRRGLDFETMFCGGFQLTEFAAADCMVLDLLRPQK
jgi:hypothetical protein